MNNHESFVNMPLENIFVHLTGNMVTSPFTCGFNLSKIKITFEHSKSLNWSRELENLIL